MRVTEKEWEINFIWYSFRKNSKICGLWENGSDRPKGYIALFVTLELSDAIDFH